jgi:hypothetical protein
MIIPPDSEGLSAFYFQPGDRDRLREESVNIQKIPTSQSMHAARVVGQQNSGKLTAWIIGLILLLNSAQLSWPDINLSQSPVPISTSSGRPVGHRVDNVA